MKPVGHYAIRITVFSLLLFSLIFAQSPGASLASQAATAPISSSTAGDSASPLTGSIPDIFQSQTPVDPQAVQRLEQNSGGPVIIQYRKSTGVASMVRGQKGTDLLVSVSAASPEAKSLAFFQQFGSLFGVRDATVELVLDKTLVDRQGMQHLTYRQVYAGLPVFGGVLHTHLDAQGRLSAVNGVFVPGIAIDVTPRISADEAAARAIQMLTANPKLDPATDAFVQLSADSLSVHSNILMVYHEGLIQNVAGPTSLVYEVQVVDGSSLREYVYIDAHTGKMVNQVDASPEALFRRLYEQNTANQVWQEGNPFPGSLNQDQQNIVNASSDSYYFFYNAFGQDSYNGAGAEMRSVNNDPTISCPNANWNGVTTNYCNGVTADDVVSHEWGHAYTEYSSNLIYQWQSGALNESYSDIWGEVSDLLNGVGTDSPAPTRTPEVCSVYTAPIPQAEINSPASIAGNYPAGSASFGPPLTQAGTTGNVVLGNDGTGSTSDACEPLVNGGAVAGNIALVDRGTCAFTIKVKNAQNAGAIAVVVANNVTGAPAGMGGADPTITIPSVMVSLSTGNLIKGELANVVNITLRIGTSTTEASYRWLMGEDATAFGSAIRDMWEPTCLSNPGKVTDGEYYCASADGGGVHTNSGVPNHGFSLLVDGGSYNGQTITALGMVKAAHIYYQAQTVYQTPTTNFSDHADALEAACSDLIGVNLEGLSTSPTPAGPSGEVIDANDCAQVSAMIAAVELRTDPSAQCNFTYLLAKNPPALCSDLGLTPVSMFSDDFEAGLGNWTLSNQGVYSGWPGLDWSQASGLPGGRSGSAAYGADPISGNCDGGAGDISGAMFMESPAILVTTGTGTRLAFDHYVSTETGWDGGNLKISINGGPYTVVPSSAYTYNPYNTTLQSAAAGNTNPLAGQSAFSGTDGGSLSGSWGQSQVNLSSLGVVPGDTIRLRYNMGMDGCNGNDGWYVDDVNVYTCSAVSGADPTISVQAGGVCGPADGTMNLLVGDAETAPASLTVSASSSNQSLVPDANIVLGGSGANRTVTITPAFRKTGNATITLTVMDGNGQTGSTTVEVIVGTNGANVLNGTAGADLILGLNGNDIINAGAGNDLACGGKGADQLKGGEGDDTLDGGDGNDRLSGEAGNDILLGQNGRDRLTGGSGADFFSGGPDIDRATDFNAGDGDTQDGTIP